MNEDTFTIGPEQKPCPICGEWAHFVHEGGDAFGITLPAPEGTITLSCRCSMQRDEWEAAPGGEIPVRTELTVLPADEPRDRTIGWSVYELIGTDLYRPPQGAVWPPTTLDEVEAIVVPANLVTAKDGLVEGEELLVQDLFGLNIATVAFHSEDGKPYGMSPSGNTMYLLEFVNDRPDEPPRWVSTGSANLRGIKRLHLDV